MSRAEGDSMLQFRMLVLIIALVGGSACGRHGQAVLQGLNDALEQQSDPAGYQLRQYQRQQQQLQQQQIYQQQQLQQQLQQLQQQQNRPRTCYSTRVGYSYTTTCY